MPAYVIAETVEIYDQEAMNEYVRQIHALTPQLGGRILAAGKQADVLEGDWAPRPALIEYPDVATCRDSWASELYRPLKVLRQRASRHRVVMFEGI